MNPQIHSTQRFEFGFPELDTLLLVENDGDEIVVRATRNTFSAKDKACFIRHLASEGFIPSRLRWASGLDSEWPEIRWVVDSSWVRVPAVVKARSRRFMTRLLLGAGLFWAAMIAVVLLWRR